jgi:hypothetical protein
MLKQLYSRRKRDSHAVGIGGDGGRRLATKSHGVKLAEHLFEESSPLSE